MTKISQVQLLEFTGASQRNVENWMTRLGLATKYEPTVQGRARGFSKENAVEISLMEKLIRAGMRPAAAAECITKLFEKIKAKKPHGWLIIFTGNDFPVDYMVTDKAPGAEFLRQLDGAAIFVNVAKLETDVDAFFAGLSDD